MSLLEFSARRLCLWVLIWVGLPVQGKAEILVIGTPAIPGTSILTSTITLTTTVEYRPSLVPGNSQYTLVGCYSPPSKDGEHIFGPEDYDAISEDKPLRGNLTIDSCLQGCGSAMPPKKEAQTYIYAGLRNGSECRCGNDLSTDLHKLQDNNCMAPCSGDPRLSCGGRVNIAVYSLKSANSQTKHPATTTTANPSTSASSTAETKSTTSQETFPSSVLPGKPASTPTVAAITGSLSGAVLVTAGVFLCYRAHIRKKRIQDAHVKSMLDRHGRRSIQTPIFTQAEVHNQAAQFVAPRHEQGGTGKSKHTEYSGVVPSTPALESGGRSSAGLHPWRGSRTAATWEERDSIEMMGQGRRSPPTTPRISAQAQAHAHVEDATSSAVHWRRPSNPNDGSSSPQSSTTHKRTRSSQIIAPPPLSARVDGLGERAWHRRKLSTPYQPPVGVGSIARAGAPSGPPAGPLPPVPQAQPHPRQEAVKETSAPPPRPRRSFDTMEFEPELEDFDASGWGADVTKEWSPLGTSLNKSTPSLGRYGSLSRSRRANTESPVLGWRTPPGRSELDAGGMSGVNSTPVLPPVAPGERFDHRRWRGTSYAEPHEHERETQGGRSQRGEGDDRSPLSASSTGTSILFGLEEFNRRL
ncbi:hypothetical protein F5B22DRAFT_460751 [Xylaria bambusicola]|uniref:uncharacterized protein n=1 Tax=Xylaria bambusicola TaxID=326684 RepID=UPI0020079F72|nr:uncharacterized protein F5B22DRAFT_460751 [Xylaria bambusicola]KAI0522135.1 hypothetical protein F5B22DRAFT_460751 [Xylaria bambusicola]